MQFKIKGKRPINVLVNPIDVDKLPREPKQSEIEIIQKAVDGIDLRRVSTNTKTVLCDERDIKENKNAK